MIEMTGMSQYADFTEQASFRDGDKLKMPDMIVRLPGDRIIAIDSKVSLSAYLDAAEQTDETARQVLLTKHGEEIWTHVAHIGGKRLCGHAEEEQCSGLCGHVHSR